VYLRVIDAAACSLHDAASYSTEPQHSKAVLVMPSQILPRHITQRLAARCFHSGIRNECEKIVLLLHVFCMYTAAATTDQHQSIAVSPVRSHSNGNSAWHHDIRYELYMVIEIACNSTALQLAEHKQYESNIHLSTSQ
jgi:hypothetical protein